MNKSPKIEPYFPADTQIFGKYPYYKFLKNRPKYLKKLRVERYDHIEDNLKKRRGMGIHIKRLTKTTKSIKALDFTEFPHEVIPLNVGQDMIKRFYKIKKISLLDSSSEKKLILLNYLYLKKLTHLRDLILCGTEKAISSTLFPHINMNRLLSKFFRFLQYAKLKKFEYKLKDKEAPYHKILNFPGYHSSIKSWAVSCCEDSNLQSIGNIHQLLNLNRLENLEKFQILAPLNLDLLNHVLQTIPRPEILKILTFQVANDENISEDLILRTKALLTKYQGLEHLAISSKRWIDIFPSNNWKLKGLSANVQIFLKESLKSLKGLLMQQQSTLEDLNTWPHLKEEPETFIEEIYDFLEGIGSLRKLKSLRIAFLIRITALNDEWWYSQLNTSEKEIKSLPILPLLVKTINELKDLKELGFKYAGASFENDFEAFFQALLLKSEILKIVEVNLAGYKIQKRDLKILVKTLPQLKALETLKIRNLVINDPDFFSLFAETIHKCSNLSCLALWDTRVDLSKYNPQEILNMLKKIFQKQNLTHIEFGDGNNDFNAFDSCEKFRLGQICKEYPHIQTLIIPFHLHRFDFPSKWKGV